MQNILLACLPFLPLLLAPAAALRRFRIVIPLAALLTLLAALSLPLGISLHLPWIMQGIHLQFDDTSRLFMLFSSMIWLVAGWYVFLARDGAESGGLFRVFFMLAFAGNVLLILAADMISFYLGFAMMGLSAYGLILQPSQQARRAARVYLAFTLVGELALFCAMLLLYSATGSALFSELVGQPLPSLAVALLLFGFGIKLALPGLHPWLPLAYTASPLIAAAVLSGPMMKAGLLGWIRFLPMQGGHLAAWGDLLMWAGSAGLLLGSALALMQQQPRAVLAYSSIAKMGLISFVFGYALANPAQAELVVGALVLFAMHHLLVKSSLFLGLIEMRRNPANGYLLFAIALIAMSLAGLPWSGGSAAKLELMNSSQQQLGMVLKLSGIATALMMIHFLRRLQLHSPIKQSGNAARTYSPASLVAWLLLIPLAWWGPYAPGSIAFDMNGLITLAAAAVVFILVEKYFTRPNRFAPLFRPGDIYHLLRLVRLRHPLTLKIRQSSASTMLPTLKQRYVDKNADSLSLSQPGLLWLGVTILMIVLLFLPITE